MNMFLFAASEAVNRPMPHAAACGPELEFVLKLISLVIVVVIGIPAILLAGMIMFGPHGPDNQSCYRQ